MRSYSTFAARRLLSSCFQAPPQALHSAFIIAFPSGVAEAERELQMTLLVGVEKRNLKKIWHFRLGLIIITTGSSAIFKVRYIERLNHQSLVSLGEMYGFETVLSRKSGLRLFYASWN